ncbi:MAG TPA: hypothetical protein VK027_04605, partial [Chitinophagaceae bacterium]|nr:hypothetical protein [Chitinophagaceae bacterium]
PPGPGFPREAPSVYNSICIKDKVKNSWELKNKSYKQPLFQLIPFYINSYIYLKKQTIFILFK